MKLIFIRHGDPDYVVDGLTDKGKKEAALLARRVSLWKNVTKFYQSPLGRAKETASISLAGTGQTAETLDWLMEFYHTVKDPVTGTNRIAWDLLPSYWTKQENFYDRNNWINTDFLKTGPIEENYKMVCKNFDDLLLQYGYEKKDGYYKTNHNYVTSKYAQSTLSGHNTENITLKNDDTTLVFFCHLGVSFLIISHILGLSPVQLWQSFFVAPTSITILGAEERLPGEVEFRIERLGDVTHLYKKFDGTMEEPVSSSGYFTEAFQY